MDQRSHAGEGILQRLFPRYAANRPLLAYVALVVSSGAGLLLWNGLPEGSRLAWPFLWWLLLSVGAEFLWLETSSGDGTESMATTTNLAVLCLWPLDLALWIIGASVVLATRFIQKRDAVKTAFSLGQMVWTGLVSGFAWRLVHPGPTTMETFREPVTALAVTAAAGTYFFVNTFLVTGAVSLERGLPFWDAWRTNYGYRNSVLSSVALFSLSPLLIVAFLGIGYVGVLFFFLPLLIIKNQNREHIEMEKLHKRMIQTERLAAQGEMARKIGHDINNFLMAISGRIQLLAEKARRLGDSSMVNDTRLVQEQVHHMGGIAKELFEMAPKEAQLVRTDLAALVQRAIEYSRPMPVFSGIELVPELDPELVDVDLDEKQMLRVLGNLLKNAAEAMQDARETLTPPLRIVVKTTRAPHGAVRVEVQDTGPGMPPSIQEKILQTSFTTKKTGHGIGIASCVVILQKHGGRLWVRSELGSGTSFFLEWPRHAKVAGRAGEEGDPTPGAGAEAERGAA